MLITFRVANFLSFNDEIELSMLGGQQRLLPTHALTFGKGRDSIDILKTAVIYGANASGKSNLIKAMDFARKIIVNGIKSEATYNKYFRLDVENSQKPSKFEFELKVGEKMYAYGFSMLLDTKKVLSEWLFEVHKNNDTVIFEREVLDTGKSTISFNLKFDKKGKNRFDVYQEDILDTQLLLTQLNEKNLKDIKGADVFTTVFNWFDTHLMILKGHDLDSMLLSLSGFIHFNNMDLEKYFTLFNTGITKIVHKELPVEQIEWAIKTYDLGKFMDTLKNNKTISENAIFPFTFWFDGKQQRFAFSKTNKGDIKMMQLVALTHLKKSDKTVEFDMQDLSDGTQRVLDLLPFLNIVEQNSFTIIIDEIDRSLHPELTHKLIEVFHTTSEGIESQLIVTSHESSLLDLSLLRRDEIWFVEKNENGESEVYSLEKFKPRHDAELRKAYLLGRFGAIPSIDAIKTLGWNKNPNLQMTPSV